MILTSNLANLIKGVTDDCFAVGSGRRAASDGLSVSGEWVNSSHKGYSVIRFTFKRNEEILFAYDDYGTECVL